VRIVAPSGFVQTSANPPAISISRGDVNVSNVNFTLARTPQAPSAIPSGPRASDASTHWDFTDADLVFTLMGKAGRS
jgi:hypothetical protein